MKRITVVTRCPAMIEERWTLDVPDDTALSEYEAGEGFDELVAGSEVYNVELLEQWGEENYTIYEIEEV